ncbi:MAG: hypothetical protein R3314_15220 [Longimicrobiales bacterium]|nr:hypothetical protein [Longimicrobiales bacterium]
MDERAVTNIVRSVGSVVAGLAVATLVVVLLTWVAVLLMLGGDMTAAPTGEYLAVNLTYSFFAAVLGGWVAARIALHRPLLHAGIVGAVMLVLAMGGEAPDGPIPSWYGTVIGVVGATGALTGGWLRARAAAAAAESAPGSD